MLVIEQAFQTSGNTIYEFFQRPGIGFYIPLYQREYSWDQDNIEQLLDDIARGIERIAEGHGQDEIRFLGTIISVQENDKGKIEPIDKSGLPSVVEKIIDGQQRISTIALFATQLYDTISELERKAKTSWNLHSEIEEVCDGWKSKLIDVFSLDLKRGNPKRKPKIIRGSEDKWVKDGEIGDAYKSDVASYLANFIQNLDSGDTQKTSINSSSLVGKNIKRIKKWINNEVLSAQDETDTFKPGWEIVENLEQKHLWEQIDRPELVLSIKNYRHNKEQKTEGELICKLVQLFSVCHYLLERCCFTHILPSNDDWAFDMFQSLNASGTPLTAIETFKPIVVKTFQNEFPTHQFKTSDEEKGYRNIEELFSDSSTAAAKSKLTNDFISSLTITVNGKKEQSHFSIQKRWLEETFLELDPYSKKKAFINFLGNYSLFYKDIWIGYKGISNELIPKIQSNNESELASVLLLFLKESNHKMAIAVLGRFYSDILRGVDGSIQNFIEAIKLISAFYIIWRSSNSNSGLDSVYRQFFKTKHESGNRFPWVEREEIKIDELRHYLISHLEEKDILSKDKWVQKASLFVKYQHRQIVKILLIISSHDSIPDPQNGGFIKHGVPKCNPYLKVEKWNSKGVKTIEHVCPQKASGSWDEQIYANSLVDSLGNLTLLPTEINISASNKGWIEKYLYYRHLSENDPQRIQELELKASTLGINLKAETLDILRHGEYNKHIEPITALGEQGNWDANFVQQRTNNILDNVWDKIIKWIEG